MKKSTKNTIKQSTAPIWWIVVFTLLILFSAIGSLISIDNGIIVSPIGTSDATTLVTAALVICFSFYALGKAIVPLTKLQKALLDACVIIENTSRRKPQNVYIELVKTLFADDTICGELWQQYVKEHAQASGEEENTYDDIAVYFNPQTICDKLEHNHLLELLPGIFTGLGILGTFVGLIIGLYGFKMGDSAAMIKTMPVMIEGLWTAFITSIFGISMSLVYSVASRSAQERAQDCAERFVQVFYDKVSKRKTHNDALSKIVDIEKEQADSLKDFAEVISIQISQNLNEIVAPTMRQLNQLMEKFVETSAEKQVDGITMMTDKFIENLDEVLGDNLEELGETMRELCAQSRENFETIGGVVEQMNEQVKNISKINTDLRETLQAQNNAAHSMAKAADRFEKVQEKSAKFNTAWQDTATELTERFVGGMEQGRKITEEQSLMLKECVEIKQSNLDTAEKIRDIAEQIHQTTDALIIDINNSSAAFAESAKTQAESIQAIAASVSEDMRGSAETLKGANEHWREELTGFAEQMCGTLNSGMETAAHNMNETIEAALKQQTDIFTGMMEESRSANAELMNSIVSSNQTMQEGMNQQAEQFKAIADSVSTDMRDSAETLSDSSRAWKEDFAVQMERSYAELGKAISTVEERMSGVVSDTVQQQLNGMREICDIMDKQTQQYAQDMREMYKKMSGELTTDFTDAFKQFEDNMSHIVNHLSGTIIGIQDVTKDVQDVTKEIQPVIQKAFDRFEKEMDLEIKRMKSISEAHRSGAQ